MNKDSSTDRLEEILKMPQRGCEIQEWADAIQAYATNRAIEELENLREQVKHENLRTISQVITSRINQLKGEQ